MKQQLKTITQVIEFQGTKAGLLYSMYTNAAVHAEVTGAPAIISDHLGEPFNLYGGYCFGENIDLKKDRLILQSWRTENWPMGFDDSIVIIRLMEEKSGTRLYLTHADIPSALAGGLDQGWKNFYWEKWHMYLKHYHSPSE